MVSYFVLGTVAMIAFFLGVAVARRFPDRTAIADMPRSAAAHDSAINDPQLIVMLKEGQIIDAVRRYEELTGAGPQDSQSAVEELNRRAT